MNVIGFGARTNVFKAIYEFRSNFNAYGQIVPTISLCVSQTLQGVLEFF